MPELILSLDVGTTTARAAVFTPGGEMVALAAQPIASRTPGPGRVEQDASQIWRTTRRVMARALARAGRAPADLAALGVTSQRASALVWDRRSGRPLSPLVVWSDLRGTGRALELREAGFMLAPQQAATKLESILAGVDAPPKRLAWGNIDSFLIWKLSGGQIHATDQSQAWPTGYFDVFRSDWNVPLIEHQGIDPGLFPRLVDTWGPMGVTAKAAVGGCVPITADIADQQAALIAHGTAPGAAKVTYGTSATLDLSTGGEFVFKSMTAPPFVLSSAAGETLYCLESMVLSAGSALDWLRRVWRLGGHGGFEALAASVRDAGGAAFLPALQGLGAPYGDAERRALVAGLAASVSRAHLARAALEGVAFRVREVVEHLYGLAEIPPPNALGVDGGLTANDTFMQIQADLLGRAVRRHAIAEATAGGAAICAGLGAGLLTQTDAAAFRRYDRTFAPSIGADEADARFAAWKSQVYPPT